MANVAKTTVTHNLDVFALTSAVDQLGSVVATVEKLNGAIYTAAVTVSFLAAKRLGADWKGENEDAAKATFSKVWKQFQLVYVERGNAWFRDSEEFIDRIRAARGKAREKLTREYFGEFKGSKLVEGPARVSKFARLVFADAAANHPDAIRTLATMESPAGRVQFWTDFVRDQYGASLRALESYFQKEPKAAKSDLERIESAIDKITSLADIESLLSRLNARKDEMLEVRALLAASEDEGEDEGEDDMAEAA